MERTGTPLCQRGRQGAYEAQGAPVRPIPRGKVPTGQTAVLPWSHDRMGRSAARAAAPRHGAGLGARLPVRRVRARVPAFLVRTGIAKPAEASRSAGAPQAE